ncbi:hypothetical protein BpHYR1_001366 [Brachionus plicatilis]|uniref:Uncharacterized protein n=1 Tax=Brachionus plicatilis TaxID=10195 RepID=A0A3M7SK77_BRAPC|nr:hypothetical protein BpHYR1_001366 [Brachionus plicatilis]
MSHIIFNFEYRNDSSDKMAYDIYSKREPVGETWYTLIMLSILIEFPVAAHNQYLFGEKHKAFMLSPLSKVYKCLLSFKSHSIA